MDVLFSIKSDKQFTMSCPLFFIIKSVCSVFFFTRELINYSETTFVEINKKQ